MAIYMTVDLFIRLIYLSIYRSVVYLYVPAYIRTRIGRHKYIPAYMHTYTNTYTHTHTRTLTHTHARVHIHLHLHIQIHVNIHIHENLHVRTLRHTYTHTHAYIYIHTYTCTDRSTCTYTVYISHICMSTSLYICIYTHSRIYTVHNMCVTTWLEAGG